MSTPLLSLFTVTIPASGTKSSEIDLGPYTPVGLYIPSAFDGTAIQFEVASATGGTFVAVVDGAGSNYQKTVATSKFLPIDPQVLMGGRFIKVVSGSTESSERTLTLVGRLLG